MIIHNVCAFPEFIAEKYDLNYIKKPFNKIELLARVKSALKLSEANKVLVIGLAKDKDLRMEFEKQLAIQLEKENVIAVRSIDFFETSFADDRKTEEELNLIEQQLLEAGFDAILFSKIVGLVSSL